MKIKLIVPVFGILLFTSCAQKTEEKKEENSAKVVVDKICDCTKTASEIKQKEEELKYSNDDWQSKHVFWTFWSRKIYLGNCYGTVFRLKDKNNIRSQ